MSVVMTTKNRRPDIGSISDGKISEYFSIGTRSLSDWKAPSHKKSDFYWVVRSLTVKEIDTLIKQGSVGKTNMWQSAIKIEEMFGISSSTIQSWVRLKKRGDLVLFLRGLVSRGDVYILNLIKEGNILRKENTLRVNKK